MSQPSSSPAPVKNAETVSKSTGDSDNGSSNPEDGSNLNLGANEPKDKNDGLSGQILSLAIPALVALSVDPLMSAVDTAYVGRLGEDLGGGTVCICVVVGVFVGVLYVSGKVDGTKRATKPHDASRLQRAKTAPKWFVDHEGSECGQTGVPERSSARYLEGGRQMHAEFTLLLGEQTEGRRQALTASPVLPK